MNKLATGKWVTMYDANTQRNVQMRMVNGHLETRTPPKYILGVLLLIPILLGILYRVGLL